MYRNTPLFLTLQFFFDQFKKKKMQQNEKGNNILKINELPSLLILIGVTGFVACTMSTIPPSSITAPEPVGGYEAIEKNIVYPKEAEKTGIEGTVVVYTYVDILGDVTATIVLEGFPDTGLNEAAMDAIRKTPWKPARKVGKPVGMWVKIPVVFSLGLITPPVPVGGYDAIAKEIIYPDTAHITGIVDSIIVNVYVDKTGKVKDITISKGVPNPGINSAVVSAIKQTNFRPGTFQGYPKGSWITISVNFDLDGIRIVPVDNST